MKRTILFWMLAMLLPLSGAAATASLSIENFDIKAGETKEMVIDLTNPDIDITLVQFDLRLPAGLSLKQTNGEYDIDIAGRTTWRKHSLDANTQADGTIRFLLASSSNTVLSGSNGAIITMTLTASSTFSSGDISLENILMVSPNEEEIRQASYAFTVGKQEPSGTAELSIEQFSITAGGEAQMLIDLTNPDIDITLVQFDLSLPTGLTLKQTNGEYDIDIAGRTTWRKHSLDTNAQADGTIRFLLASSSNAALSGTEGAIISMTLQADNNFNGGDVQLKSILLVSPNEKESKPADYTFHVVVPDDNVTLTAQSYTRVYGDANPTFEYTVSEGTITSGIPTITCSATATSPVGTYDIIISKGTVSNGNVNLVNGTLTITQATLTASVGDYSRIEGEENPTFTVSYSGWKNGEDESVLTKKPVATTTATIDSKPGNYPITVSGGEAMNYVFRYVNGTLTVTESICTSTLSIEPLSIARGGEAQMLIDLNNPDDEITLVQFDLSLPASVSLKQTGGEYDIDITNRTTWRKHSLDANVQDDGTIRFLLASSSNAALSGTEGAIISMTLQADSNFNGGDVQLKNILLVSPNEKESKPADYTYSVPVPVKDDVTLTAQSYTRVYGDANPTFEYTVSEGTITSGTPTITCSATATSPVGTYDIIISKGTVSNGNVNLVNGTLTITQAMLTASVGDYSRIEGEENPTFTVSYSGWKNGEDESVLTKKPVATTTATIDSKPGNYPITVSGGEAMNYVFKYANGTLTITESIQPPCTSTLSVEPFSIARGGEAQMLIDLTNPDDEITLVQFDMSLPAGLSLKQTGGEYDIDIAGRTTWRKHSLDANAQADGTIRFLLASSSNAVLSGNEGAIIKMTLLADESYNGGKVVLDNILLVDPNELETKPTRYEYDIDTGISTAIMDAMGKKARIYNLSGQKLAVPQKGINIIGGKKVIVK